jgi:hypothetical protein
MKIVDSNPGSVSPTVGTSGRTDERAFAVVASAFTLPPRTSSRPALSASNITST